MTQVPKAMLAGLALLSAAGLSACANTLPCDDLCLPAAAAAEDPLQVDPIPYDAIFGPQPVPKVPS